MHAFAIDMHHVQGHAKLRAKNRAVLGEIICSSLKAMMDMNGLHLLRV